MSRTARSDRPDLKGTRSTRRRYPAVVERLEGRPLLSVVNLDPTFAGGNQALVAFNLGGSDKDEVTSMAIQGDGKMILAGWAEVGPDDLDFAVARLNPDGSPDTSFSGDGKATVPFNLEGPGLDYAKSVAIQGDGKVVLAGVATRYLGRFGFFADFAVARLNADGSLDTSFDGDGKATFTFVSGNPNLANAVAIQGDGRIIVAGKVPGLGGGDFGLVRLNADGSLDTSFDGDGMVTVDFELVSDYNSANAVAILGDGRIVVVGNAGHTDFAVARLNPDGSLDGSFSGDGRATVAFNLGGSNEETANAVAIQGDGKMILAGSGSGGSNYNDLDFAVARLNPDGSPDTSFSGDGKAIVPFNLGSDNGDYAYAVAIQGDGKVVLAGAAERDTGSDFDFAVARLNPDGSLDTSFGNGGKATLGGTGANAVAIQGDGKIVVAGASGGDFAVARLDDFRTSPPRLLSYQTVASLIGRHGRRLRRVTGLVLTFSEGLDPASVADRKFSVGAAPRARAAGKRGPALRPVRLTSSSYNPEANTVTLRFLGSVLPSRQLLLRVSAKVTDQAGNALDGDNNGTPRPRAVLVVPLRSAAGQPTSKGWGLTGSSHLTP